MEKNRLTAPPVAHLERLSTEPKVATGDVLGFANQLSGLTEDEAIILLDDLKDRRSWNLPTYMACAELIDVSRGN